MCHVCLTIFFISRSLLVEWMGGMGLKLCQLVPAGILLIGDSSISCFQEIWFLSHQAFQSWLFSFSHFLKKKYSGKFPQRSFFFLSRNFFYLRISFLKTCEVLLSFFPTLDLPKYKYSLGCKCLNLFWKYRYIITRISAIVF